VSHKVLNLGILAHVDAGKTTLTERLLYTAGVIEQPGSVDAGTTQTDSLALERQRGITIKSAVASFPIGDVTVNLIDTPGHPDFIAEVERVLSVLDGAVLVISAVEGVQPQTRILFRSLQRLGIPTLLFVNKIDRPGADADRVFAAIAARLTPAVVAMGRASALGARGAEFAPATAADDRFKVGLTELLAENDESVLAAYVTDDADVPFDQLRGELAAQTAAGLVHPVFFGSAMTGAGVAALIAGLTELLPAAAGDADAPVSGRIFKIERSRSGERIAYVRMLAGTLHARDRISFSSELDHTVREGKVTSIAVFERGPAAPRPSISAGEIGQLRGLADVQIGDHLGEQAVSDAGHQFPPPTLESAIVTRDPADRGRLRVALSQIAEQDPLINVRQDDERQEIYVSLYGEVQKEVIAATLADDFGVETRFRETTMICVERLAGPARALEVLQSDDHPYSATIGLIAEPGPPGSGVEFRLDVDPRLVPLYIYKTRENFIEAMTRYVRDTLRTGRYGWEVTDCVVTMNECAYYVGDGMGKQLLATTRSTAADFRKLTPLVLTQVIERAGTVVCEPVTMVRLELPADRIGPVLAALARIGAAVGPPELADGTSVVEARLASARVHLLQQQLPGLTAGEGVLETSFGGYEPVHGRYPCR
jgi:ribosomal protection tetracycline resistance protein